MENCQRLKKKAADFLYISSFFFLISNEIVNSEKEKKKALVYISFSNPGYRKIYLRTAWNKLI